MLTESEISLLTGAVDGELSPAEARSVLRLLKRSEEARRLLDRLKRDAQRLRGLPFVPPPEDLSRGVMDVIRERDLTPTPPPPAPRAPRPRPLLPAWATLAAAAAVLGALALGAVRYFAVPGDRPAPQGPDRLVKAPPQRPAPRPSPKGFVGPAVPPAAEPDAGGPEEVLPEPGTAHARNTPAPQPPERLPPPRPVEPDAITAPSGPDPEPFAVVQIRLALILTLRELPAAPARQKLREELKRASAVRVELFCKDSAAAFGRLRAAFKSRGHALLVDALARELLKNKAPAHYVFYADSLTRAEIAGVLETLGKEDLAAEKKKEGSGQFDKFVMTPFQPADEKDLSRLLGVPAGMLRGGRLQHGRAAPDPTRPLSESTAGEVSQSLAAGRNKSPRNVLVLPFSDRSGRALRSPPALSKEIRSFVQQARETREDSIPVLLVLRTVNE